MDIKQITEEAEILMTENKYNPIILFIMKAGVWILFFAILIYGCVIIFYSLMGVIYNPIYHFPTDCINSFFEKKFISIFNTGIQSYIYIK